MSNPADQLPDDEIARQMERGIRRALSTPPQPHGKNPEIASTEIERATVRPG
jgi:hypothetical protein